MRMLANGTMLNRRYRIDGLLEQAGGAALYRAWDVRRNVAVVVQENPDGSPAAGKRFAAEAGRLARLTHPNLPRISDHFFIPGQGQYLVTSLLSGEDLLSVVQQRGAIAENQVVAWIEQVCDGLEYLHSQAVPIIHGDLKPANLWLGADGRVMLLGVGLAGTPAARPPAVAGGQGISPGYSAPEQYGGGAPGPGSDIYALGATLYHLLTGRVPLESVRRLRGEKLPPPRALNSAISPGAEHAVLTAMELDVTRRFPDVHSLRTALRTAQAAAGMAQHDQVKPPEGRRVSPGMALGLAVLLVGLLVLVMVVAAVNLPSPLAQVPTPTGAARDSLTPTVVARVPSSPVDTPTTAPTPTFTPIETATSIPTSTPTSIPTSTPTSTPSWTATSTPTDTPVAATPIPSPTPVTPTPTLVPTFTPTPTPVARPELLQPQVGSSFQPGNAIILQWSWEPGLAPDQRFRAAVRGQTGTILQFPTNGLNVTLPALDPGEYIWVVVVEGQVTGTWREVTRSAPGTFVVLPPTEVPSPTPRAATPQPTVVAPELVAPFEGDTAEQGRQITLRWRWPGDLPDQCGFEVMLWKEGQEPEGAEDVRETMKRVRFAGDGIYEVGFDPAGANAVFKYGSGEYLWSVHVVQLPPAYQPVSPLPPGRKLMVREPGGAGAG